MFNILYLKEYFLISIAIIILVTTLYLIFVVKNSKVVIRFLFFMGMFVLLLSTGDKLELFIENNPQIVLPGIGVIIVLSIIFYFFNAFKKLKKYKNDEKLFNEKKAQIKEDIQNVIAGIVIVIVLFAIMFVPLIGKM